MNTLQRLDMGRYGPVICTLNPNLPIREETVQARIQYEHPTFDTVVGRTRTRARLVDVLQAERCQRAMATIQNTRGILYAGAWMGYGFHEDGFTSGLRAAVAIGGVQLPFLVRTPNRQVEALWVADMFDALERVRKWLAWILFAFLYIFGH